MDPSQTGETTQENVVDTTTENDSRIYKLDQSTTREQRVQLKALSQEIFGKSSRYQKLYEYDEVLTKTVTETVPGVDGAPDKEETKEVPVLFNGSKQSRRRYRSTSEVLDLMVNFKAKRDEFLAQMKQQQEEAKKRKEEAEALKKVQDELGGSALT